MIHKRAFDYVPDDHESEKASNSYLMSLLAFMIGVPLPIVNLLATLIFFLGNRNASRFVRWHCTQALFAQFFVLFINSYGFWWTMSIIFGDESISNNYIAYVLTALGFNLTEIIFTIVTAVRVRKREHMEWWLFGPLTNLIFKRA
jgi:uncharacterized membrane protein